MLGHLPRIMIFICFFSLFCSAAFADESKLVRPGDALTFDMAQITNPENMKKIEWSQSFQDRSAQYLQVTAVKKGKDPVFVMLFVQKILVPKITDQCKDELCTVKIDKNFQYGQDAEKTMRFVVFHNKENKPYQHRFRSTSTLSTFANGAEVLSKKVQGLGLVPGANAAGGLSGSVVKGFKSVVGDPLRDY